MFIWSLSSVSEKSCLGQAGTIRMANDSLPFADERLSLSEKHLVHFTGYAYGGEALGRLTDGRLVFVPYALDGEVGRVVLEEEHRGYVRGRLIEVLHPSPQRVAPRCRHFGECGGCHYQHITYAGQLEAKEAILMEQLKRLAGLTDLPLQPIIASPNSWYYRNHVQFHLTSEGRLGYHRARSAEGMAIEECHLPEPPLGEIWPLLEFEVGVPLDRVGLRLGAEGEAMLIFEGRQAKPPAVSVESGSLSVVYLGPHGAVVLAGSPDLEMAVHGKRFFVSAGSFFQVNTGAASLLVEEVLRALGEFDLLGGKATLLDLYCGVGLFSAFLAPWMGEVIAVEAAPSAAEDFTRNLDDYDHVTLYEATVEQVLSNVSLHPNVVLLDPPRAGVSRQAMDALLRLRAEWILYVSCDVATLARDARRLVNGGYVLQWVKPLDMFPQTYAIESLSLWRRQP